MVNSFNGSRETPMGPVDPYWGGPEEGLDERPLSRRGSLADEPETASDEIIPDLKIGQLFMHHIKDWLVIILLFIAYVVLNVIHPFRSYVGEYNIESLRLPHKKDTIPVWSVPIYGILLPILIFIGYFFKRRNARDLHHAILGILTACLLTGLLTDGIKNAAGRPRPDFFWRCFPNGGPPVYTPDTREVICFGEGSAVREGYKSFPSGHASWSFASLGYLSFYLAGKVVIFDRRGFTWRLLLVVLPLLAAALVGVSRLNDNRHHWRDIVVGSLLGLGVAYFCYKQHFPDFSDEKSGYPYPHIPGYPHLPSVSRPSAFHVSHHGIRDPVRSTGSMVIGGPYGGRPNGGSYDVESGRIRRQPPSAR